MIKAVVYRSCRAYGRENRHSHRGNRGDRTGGCRRAEGAPAIGTDIGERLGLGRSGSDRDDLTRCIEQGDVVIDFTSPAAHSPI